MCDVRAGWSGPLSPCGSTISCGAAPTIPSAPLSPVDSELFDESRFFLHTVSERSDASTPVPASTAAATCNFADSVKSIASSYQFEGSRAYRRVDGSGNASGNFIGSATWSPQSTLVNPAGEESALIKGSSYSSYSHLRYPPLVLHLMCLLKVFCYFSEYWLLFMEYLTLFAKIIFRYLQHMLFIRCRFELFAVFVIYGICHILDYIILLSFELIVFSSLNFILYVYII